MNEPTADASAEHPNLTTHRAAASVWERRGWDGPADLTVPRWLVGVGAGALAAEGLRRGGARGSFFAGLGGTLLWWALAGHGDLSTAREWFTGVRARSPGRSEDPVQEASAESFPASDPPAFTAAVGAGVRPAGR